MAKRPTTDNVYAAKGRAEKALHSYVLILIAYGLDKKEISKYIRVFKEYVNQTLMALK